MNKNLIIAQLGAVLIFGAAGTASATSLTFDFNTLSSSGNNASVQTYMNTKLGAAGTVVVTGSQADAGYTGDGHVVGAGSLFVNSMTLGNTEGATVGGSGSASQAGSTDRFITNQPGVSNSIVMKFTGLTINSVSFDYEIFPDSGCANGNTCGSANFPDFKFKVNGSNQIFQYFGVMPGTNGTYSSSEVAWFGSEKAPQRLGTTGTILLPAGITELDFVDWPAMIGVDNLKIDYSPSVPVQPVPEPASMVLLGTGLLGVAYKSLKRKK